MAERSPIVITRVLRPKPRRDVLRRQRLLDFLHEHIDRKLILLCAGAGYGKTSLLVDFAQDSDVPVCWYTVSDADRDLRTFCEYILASIRQQFPRFGRHTDAFLASASGANIDPGSLASVLVNDLYNDIPEYFALVIDDYHRGEEESINFFLDSLLQDLPDNCHIILSTRSVPRLTPKGMALLIARREIEGLGTNDLRFDANEIRALLAQNFHQHIPYEQAEMLAREAEGWITGIILTTHSLWKGLFAGLLEAKGAGSTVYDYLANEVFNTQPPDIQTFLRQTSILDEMTPSLCNRLLNRHDARHMLNLLEERNLFINHVERETEVTYRYHHLFQQYLQQRAAEAGEKPLLHARAAAILEQDGDLPAAIVHYLAAGLYHDAARVITQAAPSTYESNHWTTLARWIDALPTDVAAVYPRVLSYRAMIHAQMSQIDEALALFVQAETGFRQQGDTAGLADVLVSRATPLRLSGRLAEAQASCLQALDILEDAPAETASSRTSAEAHRTIGICHMQLGAFEDGVEELRRSLAVYEQIGDRYGMANLHSDLGTALRMVGNMAASDLHFDQAVALWNELGASASLANTLNNVAFGYHLRGQYAKALSVYERALTIAEDTALARVQALVLTGMGDIYRDLGQYDQAFAAYNQARPIAERAQEAMLVSYILDALGHAYIQTGDFVRANELIRQAYEQARERRSRQAATLYFASLGILSYERGDPKTATDYLAEAVSVLQDIGARRDLPRIRLHLANAYYLNGQWEQALDSLELVLKETAELGYDQFLEPLGRRMLPFLRFALRQRSSDHLVSLMERIEKWNPIVALGSLPAAETTASVPRLRIYGFGEARVMRGDHPIDQREWGSAKAKELLFYLLSYPHRSKEQIGSLFWPDLSAAKVRSAFHVTVYRLRRALGVPDSILYDDERYYFNQRIEYWYDVQEFERLLAQADRVQNLDPTVYENCLKEAVALYRGDFLESLGQCGVEWHLAQAEALRQKYVHSLLALARLAGQRGEYDRALEYYRRVARKDSYMEIAHRGIMTTYVSMGDRNAALRHYRELEKHLQEELGVSPTTETTRLYEEILRGG